MLDDENDNRIKEAADHYHPEYDDMAWQKMEQLLDEHLPLEKERKRMLFIIPLLLIIGCLLLFITLYDWKGNAPEASKNVVANKSIVADQHEDSKRPQSQTSLKDVETRIKENKEIGENKAGSFLEKEANTGRNPFSLKPQSRNLITGIENDLSAKHNVGSEKEDIPEKTNDPGEVNQKNRSVPGSSVEQNKLPATAEKENTVEVEKSTTQKEVLPESDTADTKMTSPANTRAKTRKRSQGFTNDFGVSISAGPDVSAVHANQVGKITLVYGAGISYAISKKLNVRTGFYLSEKIYSVSPEDYELPYASPNYEYLEKIDANCIVYEIPVKLDYSFGKTKKHNWFVSGGVSSYLMKKETYDYNYKTPGGETYSKYWSIRNKNKHFFSVLSISGGYQYSFNKQFSVIAEPYLNLPLSGIGAGKVKLNSGGILFTVKAKPFLKSH